MKTGDRVRYTGNNSGFPCRKLIGTLGTVTGPQPPGLGVPVTWDRPEFSEGLRTFNPLNLELVTMIDTNKPLRFKRDVDRPITLVGLMPNGDPVVTSVYGDLRPWETPLVFDKNTGLCLDKTKTLEIENAPVVSSGFYPLDRSGGTTGTRGLISLSLALSDYPHNKFFVEIITIDGKPTEAKIHARP